MVSKHRRPSAGRPGEIAVMSDSGIFQLHDRLAADSLPAVDLPLCQLRLLNNRVWPWLLLIPRIAGATELHDLSPDDQMRLMAEIAAASRAVAALFVIDKINIGALGNMVSQLHVHVIGRRRDDPAWPGPVWGSGFAEPYDATTAGTIVGRLRDHFGTGDAPRGGIGLP